MVEVSSGRVRLAARERPGLPPRELLIPGRVELPEIGHALSAQVVSASGYVVPRVTGGRKAFEPDHVSPDDLDVPFRNGGELAPHRVERFAVQPPRARLEPARVDEVGRADLRDVDAQAGMLADEDPGGARVVEMDVREQEVTEV